MGTKYSNTALIQHVFAAVLLYFCCIDAVTVLLYLLPNLVKIRGLMSLNVTVGALSAPHVLPCLNMARGRQFQHHMISPRKGHIWRLWGRCIAVLLLYCMGCCIGPIQQKIAAVLLYFCCIAAHTCERPGCINTAVLLYCCIAVLLYCQGSGKARR